MNLRTAAFLALIGMIALTLVLAADFINTFLGVARDLIPAMTLLRSLVYLFAGLTLTIFLFVFYKKQS